MSARSFSVETSSLCCDETTTVSTRMGVSPSYSTLTWALPSGRRYVEHALAARLREAFAQPVRQHDRQRHQLRRLAAGVAEHQALVAGAAGVHAHRDVGRLAVDRRDDATGLAVESVLGGGVADFLDGFADQLLHVDVGVGRDLAGDEAEAGRDEGLARHAAGRILREDRIQDAVRNLIGDLVRMSFRHRLGREQIAAFTTHVSPCGSRCACQNRSILPDPPGRSTTDDVIRTDVGVLPDAGGLAGHRRGW